MAKNISMKMALLAALATLPVGSGKVHAGTDPLSPLADMNSRAKEDVNALLRGVSDDFTKEKFVNLLGYKLVLTNAHMPLNAKAFAVQYTAETPYAASWARPEIFYEDYFGYDSKDRNGFSVGGSFNTSHKPNEGCVSTGDLIEEAKSAGWEVMSSQSQTINHSVLLEKGRLRLGVISEGGIGEERMANEQYSHLNNLISDGGCVDLFSVGIGDN